MSKKQYVDFDDVFEKSELEKKEDQLNKRKKRRPVIRRRRRLMVFITVVSIITIYMCTDYSSIRVVLTYGNTVYSKQELLSIAEIEYNTKSILYPWFIIENRLEDDVFIENARVSISWDGIMSIEIEERRVLGYYEEEGEFYLLIENEESELINAGVSLKNVPYIYNLNEEQRLNYMEACVEVETSYLSLISEISHYETSYDDNMLMLSMQDGHTVYTTMEGFNLLNWYTTTIKGVSSANKCILFIEETNTITTQSCDEEEEEDKDSE